MMMIESLTGTHADRIVGIDRVVLGIIFLPAALRKCWGGPAEDKQGEYGSIFPMCYSQVATAMARERTAQVRRMLDDKDPCDVSGKQGF
jgi:hypothetical protein